jgi:APA family basic amino acid/polyamine antiporter
MSRDDLFPAAFGRIDARFKTPRNAVLLTGALLLTLIAFVPVIELAKLASAFQILVFSVINLALVAFREADVPSYEPEFTAPGYPYVQAFGFLAGLGLLTQMGTLPILGAAGIIVGSGLIYAVYGRSRTDRTGAVGTIIHARRGEADDGIAPTEQD